MNSKKIVVLLSTYNGEQYLEEQLESILRQKTEHQVDLLIRDDGSDDGTIKILNHMKKSMLLVSESFMRRILVI